MPKYMIWKNVEEALPFDPTTGYPNEKYLVIAQAWGDRFIKIAEYFGGNNWQYEYQVSHWMELPRIPKTNQALEPTQKDARHS